jgi:transketolase
MQVDGHTDKVMKLEPLAEKWRAFGWEVHQIDGNSLGSIIETLNTARATRGRPTCIIADTVPGKGVPFLENRLKHMAAISPDEAQRALQVLGS